MLNSKPWKASIEDLYAYIEELHDRVNSNPDDKEAKFEYAYMLYRISNTGFKLSK